MDIGNSPKPGDNLSQEVVGATGCSAVTKSAVPLGTMLSVPLTEEQVRHLPSIVRDLAGVGLEPVSVEVFWGCATYTFHEHGEEVRGPLAVYILGTPPPRPRILLHLLRSDDTSVWQKWGARHG